MKPLAAVLAIAVWLGGCALLPDGLDLCPSGRGHGVMSSFQIAAVRHHTRYGHENLRQGHCDKALEEFRQALEIDPYNRDAKAGMDDASNCLEQGEGPLD
ncbi:MAG: hypothetical protein V2A77_02255 [Pseudomonadota bacterium]